MCGVFDFVYNICKYFIEQDKVPSATLMVVLMMALDSPEFESDMKFILDKEPEKVIELLKMIKESLKKDGIK